MAAILSRPHCVFVFVFVFDELYLYLYLIRFLPVYLYLYLYLSLKLRKKMYLYLYLIKRIWPQPCLWETFQWILPLYLKPVSFQSKASVVCSVTAAIFIDFCLKKLNVFSQHIGKKNNKWISEFRRTNPPELKCWSTFCVYYFLRYYLMMQHEPIVKRVNGTHEWAHRSYQLLSTPYHCCLYKHRRQYERQPIQSSWPVPICT